MANNNTKKRRASEPKGQYAERKSKQAKVARGGCKDGLSMGEQRRIFYGQ
jgi:hypothetical protein